MMVFSSARAPNDMQKKENLGRVTSNKRKYIQQTRICSMQQTIVLHYENSCKSVGGMMIKGINCGYLNGNMNILMIIK